MVDAIRGKKLQPETSRFPKQELESRAFEKEKESESKEESLEQTQEKKTSVKEWALKKRPQLPPISSFKDEATVKVEKILQEGLNDSYQRLSPVARQEFKLKGEWTAAQITELLKGAHIKVKKIFKLILEWLKILPGINRFFLEQEAKIKADKIVALKNKVL